MIRDLAKEMYEANHKYLMVLGLSDEEATAMLVMYKKMVVPEKDENDFYSETEEGMPFEGGMSFTEGVIASALALKDELRAREEYVPIPIWDHDCELCVYLGEFEVESDKNVYDLYYCNKGPFPTLIARFGDGADYISGLHFGIQDRDKMDSAIGEAYRRAKVQGFNVLPSGGLAPEKE